MSVFKWRGAGKPSPDAANVGAATSPVRRKRIALVGADGLQARSESWSVQCFPWTSHGEASGVADYDVAVVNLLEMGPQGGVVRHGLRPSIDGTRLLELLESISQLLISRGEVVVLGHPDVSALVASSGGTGHWTQLPGWTGLDLVWDSRSGDQVEIQRPHSEFAWANRFMPYLTGVSRYEYSLLDTKLNEGFHLRASAVPTVGAGGPLERRIDLVTRALATTRHGGAVASAHSLELATRPTKRRAEGWTVQGYAHVVLLPDIGVPPAQALARLLETAYGVHLPSASPNWLESLTAPGEGGIQARLDAIRGQISDLEAQARSIEEERRAARTVLDSLNSADDDLERAVWELLRRLGAVVTEPTEPNKEDGWISVQIDGNGHEGVLEIKGTQKPAFEEKGLRQLMEWVARGNKRGKKYKGLFIGNSAATQPPAERGDPFSPSFRASAREHGLAAVTVATLVDELRRVLDDGASPDTFWRALFATNGVYGG